MKNRLYNFEPLIPHFYLVILGFTGVYIIFLILLKNIDCGYSLEPPRWGGSNGYPQSMFWAEIWKYQIFFIWKVFIFSCKYASMGGNSIKIDLLPSEKRSTLKENNLLPSFFLE